MDDLRVTKTFGKKQEKTHNSPRSSDLTFFLIVLPLPKTVSLIFNPLMATPPPIPSPVPEWVGRLLSEVNATVTSLSSTLMRIPGSKVAVRYIRSSYQNDPIRSFIELCLVFFVVRYLTKPKYSVDKNQLKLSDRVALQDEGWGLIGRKLMS